MNSTGYFGVDWAAIVGVVAVLLSFGIGGAVVGMPLAALHAPAILIKLGVMLGGMGGLCLCYWCGKRWL